METEKCRTGLKRLWAAIVDGIVFMPLLLVERYIFKETSNLSTLFGWAAFVSFAPLIYSVVLHYKNGQTIGKWVAGIKVLDASETRRISLRQAVYRDGFYLLIAFVGLVFYSYQLMRFDDQQNTLAEYSSFSDNPVFWWTLIELITMLTNSKRRALHDFMAKSIVIRTETSS